jgi:hypothetical protein
MYRLILVFIIALFLISQPALSQEMNAGIIYGPSHAFSLSAPKG